MDREFYIGYLEKAPQGVAKFVKRAVIVIFLITAILAGLVSSKQKGFLPSTYEYYQETELSGLVTLDPVPAIQVYWGNTHHNQPLVQTIPVVAFGKIGGIELIRELQGSWVTLKGHLIYYDGKALIEVADPKTIVASGTRPVEFPQTKSVNYKTRGSFKGEIVDAKCFFGVMKPGHGKPHRSCAIRCISGGIPAVLTTRNSEDHLLYYLIDSDSETSGTLASYVGEVVTVEGELGQISGWEVIKISQISH